MNLNQLSHFAAVTKYGSMNAAAEKLFVSQSAISQSIKNLEKEFDKEFFVRTRGGKMSLNKNGERLLVYALKMLKLEEEMKLSLSNMESTVIELYSGGGKLFAPLIGKYAAENPGIRFNTRVGTKVENLKALIDGEADIVIDSGYVDDPDLIDELDINSYVTDLSKIESFCERYNLKNTLFYRIKLYLSVPKGSIYSDLDRISLENLADIPIVRSSYMPEFENWVSALEKSRHLHFNTIMTLDYELYDQIVFQNGYNTLVTSSAILYDSRITLQRKLIPVSDPLAEREFYIYWKKGMQNLDEFLVTVLSDFDYMCMLKEDY